MNIKKYIHVKISRRYSEQCEQHWSFSSHKLAVSERVKFRHLNTILQNANKIAVRTKDGSGWNDKD